jgi:hypothetical protein
MGRCLLTSGKQIYGKGWQVSVIVFVVYLFVQQTFVLHGANCSYEREKGERERERERENILTMNSSRMNLIDCRGHLKTMEYMKKSHGV